MIWCIIGITLFILAFVFNKLYNVYDYDVEIFEGLSIISFIISITIIAVTATLFVLSNSYAEKAEVQKFKDQHDAYVALLEENKDITVQNQLYKDIVEYNTTLRKKKHYSKSLWTNWFFSDGWNELEYIDLK